MNHLYKVTCTWWSTVQPTMFSADVSRLIGSVLGAPLMPGASALKIGAQADTAAICTTNHKTVSTLQTVNTTTSATVNILDAQF